MAPPRKQALPKPLPDGFLLIDSDKKKWRLGKIIGRGGFGLIYLASQDVDRTVPEDTNFVIKVEYKENGPLFSELKFYQRAAKPESMQNWMKSRKLKFLGIPKYWGSGLAEYNNLSYRFMAMDRFGSDIQKFCEHNGGRLKETTVLQLGRLMVDILEYIHENEYVHADIKAANLMQGYRDSQQVYLVDYGLSYRYCPDGVHKEYKENPKKGHNGTIEYTSVDAHKGVAPSRRGDFQILGFCLLHWLCGSLPWDHVLKNPDQVLDAKIRLMDKLPQSVQNLSVNGANTGEVAAFLNYVKSLGHQQQPDYKRLKDLLARGGEEGNLDFSIPREPAGQLSTKHQDPPAKGKKVGQGRGASKLKSGATELDDDDEEKEVKPKPGAAHHRGQSPLTDSESKKEEVRRSSRTSKPKNYAEAIHSEEDDGVQESRPKRIPACYIRGPPIGPRTQSKKIREPKRTSMKTDDFPVSSVKHGGEESVQPQRIKRMLSDGDPMCSDFRDRCHGGVISHRTVISTEPASFYKTRLCSYVFAVAVLSFIVLSLGLETPFNKISFPSR